MEIHHSNLKSDGAKPKGPKQTVKEKFVVRVYVVFTHTDF